MPYRRASIIAIGAVAASALAPVAANAAPHDLAITAPNIIVSSMTPNTTVTLDFTSDHLKNGPDQPTSAEFDLSDSSAFTDSAGTPFALSGNGQAQITKPASDDFQHYVVTFQVNVPDATQLEVGPAQVNVDGTVTDSLGTIYEISGNQSSRVRWGSQISAGYASHAVSGVARRFDPISNAFVRIANGTASLMKGGSEVQQAPIDGGDFSFPVLPGTTTQTYTVAYLGNTNTESSTSGSVAVAPDPTPPAVTFPSKPRRIKLVAKNHKVVVRWRTPRSNGGARINRYQVEGPTMKKVRATRHRVVYKHLKNGKRYTFFVRAHNKAGWGPWSTGKSVRPRR